MINSSIFKKINSLPISLSDQFLDLRFRCRSVHRVFISNEYHLLRVLDQFQTVINRLEIDLALQPLRLDNGAFWSHKSSVIMGTIFNKKLSS